MMGLSVASHQARTVHRKNHMQLLQGDIMDQHVKAALQEARIYGKHRREALLGHAGRHGRGVALGDADIGKAFGIPGCKAVETGAVGHGRRNRHQFRFFFRKLTDRLAEAVGEASAGRRQLARLGVEGADTVVDLRMLLGVLHPVALLGQHMDKNRLFGFPRQTQHRFQLFQVMSVHRAEIVQAHCAEHVHREQLVLHLLLQVMVEGVDRRHSHEHIPIPAFEPDISRADPHALQQTRRPTHVRINRHVVVVQDDDQRLLACRRGRQTLIGQPACQCAVADHGNNVIVLVQQRARLRHPHRHGHRVGGMSGNEGIIFPLIRLREPGQAAILTQGIKAVPASGDDFVGIALMPHVKDDAVFFGVIDAMQRQRQLHNAEIGRQVPAGFGYRLHKKTAQFLSKRTELFLRKTLDIK